MATEGAKSGEAEAVVLIKAAPQVGSKHGETVCCAALDLYGKWLRLYPVSFRYLDEGKKFGRWDRIRFRWRLPQDDRRLESRRVDQDTLEIVGDLKPTERERFLARAVVTSLDREREAGRSLALLQVEVRDFRYERKTPDALAEERAKFEALHAQQDMFNTKPLIPYEPCPFRFKYRYRTEDGQREGTCQDWEIEATYYRWSREYGETAALDMMVKTFGEDYPRKGMLLAMGTHSLYPDVWLINGVIRLDHVKQMTLF
ncbi:hypothetical protein D3093_17055 (plasmid) [Azospirillum argentinense]|uniref:Uncharacterized protein n=1 Tax=Azospirillum argentinense TaxID=2970906 RepID=A0A4D8PKM2_9PROT|nr:hypothetical protein [Azospirillum argentinense]QCN97007.1 hypothetical protein D3093_17055 [Azospirillum argentinense]